MKQILGKVKSNKGITLISLAVAVSILLIVTGTLIYKAQDTADIKKLKGMYDDIGLLDDKVEAYYMQTGCIPKGYAYDNVSSIENKNSADGVNYYVVDLNALDGITTLNYGRGYANIVTDNSTEKDVYIINEVSHQIYYVRGIKSDDVTYYTNEPRTVTTTKSKYIIKYDANGGTGYIDDNVLLEGKEIQLNYGLSFKKDGLYINGWIDQDGNFYELGSTLKQNDGGNVINKNLTLKALWKKLPREYQEVEYIESTGTQYIDTGLNPKLTLGFDCIFQNNNTSDAAPRIW